MLNIKEMDNQNLNDINDIFLFGYYTFCKSDEENIFFEGKLNSVCVINKEEVFEEILSIGKTLWEVIEQKNSGKSALEIIESAFNYNEQKNKLFEICKQWFIKNGYPYNYKSIIEKNEISYFYFIKDTILLYLFFEIHKYIFKYSINKQNRKKVKPLKLLYLISLIKEMLICNANDNNSPFYDNIINSENYFYLLDEANEKNDLDNYLNVIRRAMITTIFNKIFYSDNKGDFLISKQIPIYNSFSGNYRIYECAYSIIGISYNELLFHLTAKEWSYKMVPCKYHKCINSFEKNKNQHYCINCIENGIPEKERNQVYNSTTRKNKKD